MGNILSTDRLSLRHINYSDLALIHKLHSIPETDRYNTLGIPESLLETKMVITPWIAAHLEAEIKAHTFAIALESVFIGLIGLKLGSEKYRKAEVWYKLDKAYWGKGFATEALNSVLDFGFKVLKLHRIEAGCAVDNRSSIRVLEKTGMIREGRKRQVLPLKSGWSDNFEYAILASDRS